MRLYFTSLTALAVLVTAAVAKSTTCENDEIVVCKGNGNAGLLSLGNIAPGLLGDNCSSGPVYCCSQDDVEQVQPITASFIMPITLERSDSTP
ncbi:hypothetical protein N7509_001315 [Penicillium cosmopolitanum]|uniref:Hydrophobin n=1 Tax=Penicillium cosmopolitanum TaxID=1131564 RepID=A0A9W9WCH2_9EURO|nr:uncharacterized protein N7509_001315 [Penicillium cosmopolitanum]KAJ5414688.1 hypothetical protein N7509_001315 [Penicillium cosmopolitanum]